jgi:hypothetical protein
LAKLKVDGLAIARVFLRSKGTKIVRHSPVPVLVLPNQNQPATT